MNDLSLDDLNAVVQQTSPRVRFIKGLPRGASILDLGAGDGSLALFKSWLLPKRSDLRLYGVSLEDGPHTHLYDGWENGDFEAQEPFSGRMFDAVFSAHFAEHVQGGVARVIPWMVSRLEGGGRIYVELPSDFSKNAPSRQAMLAAGYHVSTTNFFDDATHKDTIDLSTLTTLLTDNQIFVEESGYWRNPYLEQHLLELPKQDQHQYHGTIAVWMATRFAQYAVGVKDDVHNPTWRYGDTLPFTLI